jgi:hypothetical protein
VVADVHVQPDNGIVHPAARADSAAMCPGGSDWAVDEQLAELGRTPGAHAVSNGGERAFAGVIRRQGSSRNILHVDLDAEPGL